MHAADWQTLFTHNHTIICFSLEEGLTSSSHAYHAGARCHKKDYCVRGFARDHDRRKLYIFIHFRRHRVDCSTQLDLELFSHTYGKTAICKSCDHIPVHQISKNHKVPDSLFLDHIHPEGSPHPRDSSIAVQHAHRRLTVLLGCGRGSGEGVRGGSAHEAQLQMISARFHLLSHPVISVCNSSIFLLNCL